MSNSPSQSSHLSNQDFEFFYRGLAQATLLIQKCRRCCALRNPPCPMCPRCQSLEWFPIESTGAGTIYSYTIHYHPPLPHFDTPHPIAVVELDEGIRMLGALRGVSLDRIRIGMSVKVAFGPSAGRDAFWFVPANKEYGESALVSSNGRPRP